MAQHVDIGGIEIGDAADGDHRAGRAEGRHQVPSGGLLLFVLRRAHDAAEMADRALTNPKTLHHAVAIEPVMVSMAGAFVPGRAVAIEAADKLLGPGAVNQFRFTFKAIGGHALPALETRLARKRRIKAGFPFVGLA